MDAYAKGSWDDIRRAYRRGLLSEDEWEVLFRLHAGSARGAAC